MQFVRQKRKNSMMQFKRQKFQHLNKSFESFFFNEIFLVIMTPGTYYNTPLIKHAPPRLFGAPKFMSVVKYSKPWSFVRNPQNFRGPKFK